AVSQLADADFRGRLEQEVGAGAVPQVEVRLLGGARQEGDPQNRLLEIAFADGAPGTDEQQYAFLRTLFGSAERHPVTLASNDDVELSAASDRAKRRFLA